MQGPSDQGVGQEASKYEEAQVGSTASWRGPLGVWSHDKLTRECNHVPTFFKGPWHLDFCRHTSEHLVSTLCPCATRPAALKLTSGQLVSTFCPCAARPAALKLTSGQLVSTFCPCAARPGCSEAH
eukprot:gene4605-14798_t